MMISLPFTPPTDNSGDKSVDRIRITRTKSVLMNERMNIRQPAISTRKKYEGNCIEKKINTSARRNKAVMISIWTIPLRQHLFLFSKGIMISSASRYNDPGNSGKDQKCDNGSGIPFFINYFAAPARTQRHRLRKRKALKTAKTG
jgi:hypothetical protein